ncbi:MAG: DUF3786 domain-containing protein [Deltaproteobacteria bacterium]|nr:DUF3786 domain-containing protein [Deltaproteobacteria bacterium]
MRGGDITNKEAFAVPTRYAQIISDNLSKLFSRPLSELEGSIGAKQQGTSLIFHAFGAPCVIEPDRITLSGVASVDPKGLLVSLYARHATPHEIQREPFISFKDFQGSMPYQGAFSANSERVLIPHVPLIQAHARTIKAAFNGEDGDLGDFSLILYPFPKIALCYICYLADDEFPASVTILFSANALSFMPLDGLADVAEYTSKEIIQLVSQ